MSFTKTLRLAFFYLAILGLAACASLNVNLPSVTEEPTGERMPGKIIWRDLLTNDPAASQKFYGELFGWTFESVGTASNLTDDSAYTLIRHNGKLIGGMIDTIALNKRRDISQWVALMSEHGTVTHSIVSRRLVAFSGMNSGPQTSTVPALFIRTLRG